MNPITTQITAGGVTYTFRLPSSQDMMQMDLEALQMRSGVSEGLPLAVPHSQNVAALQRLCTQPEDVNFAELPFYVVNKLGGGLWKWLNSFSEPDTKPVGQTQG